VWKNPCIQNDDDDDHDHDHDHDHDDDHDDDDDEYKDLSRFQTWPTRLPQLSAPHWTHCCSSTLINFVRFTPFRNKPG
jgi:hypothetical protein